jgi:hypothetical protein
MRAFVQSISVEVPGRYRSADGKRVKLTAFHTSKWKVRFDPPHAGHELVCVSAIWDESGSVNETHLFPVFVNARSKVSLNEELDGSIAGYSDCERLIRELGYEIDWSEFTTLPTSQRWVREEEPKNPSMIESVLGAAMKGRTWFFKGRAR